VRTPFQFCPSERTQRAPLNANDLEGMRSVDAGAEGRVCELLRLPQ
jgi:hypothetical protein